MMEEERGRDALQGNEEMQRNDPLMRRSKARCLCVRGVRLQGVAESAPQAETFGYVCGLRAENDPYA